MYWEDGNLTRVLKSLPTDLTDVKGTIVVYGKVRGPGGYKVKFRLALRDRAADTPRQACMHKS